MIDIFLAFTLACTANAEGVPGAGPCRVSPPNNIHATLTLCKAELDDMKKGYEELPQLSIFHGQGGRLFFGCYKSQEGAQIPDVKDVIKEIRK